MVFSSDAFDSHEEVVFASDAASGLRAIIAVHSTALGPAIGGCRILDYPDEAAAVRDVLRLSRGMTYKAAVAGVPFGGGKAVVMRPPGAAKTPQALRALGAAIEKLGGRYVTGEDVGTTAADMTEIRRATGHVMGMPAEEGGSGDPSPNTALGCFVGMRASIAHALGRRDFDGLRVIVQGLGNVGFNLCRLLAEAGARLFVSDIRPALAETCAARFNATVVPPEQVFDVDAEVFSPCALGGVINDATLPRLRVTVIAGGANNQLERPAHGDALRSRGILYAPDYVINGGGMIQLAMERLKRGREETEQRVRGIEETLAKIYRASDVDRMSTHEAAERLVRVLLSGRSAAA